jgi:hypothetical protein
MTEKKLTLSAGGKTMDIKELDAEIAKMTAGTGISLFHVENRWNTTVS